MNTVKHKQISFELNEASLKKIVKKLVILYATVFSKAMFDELVSPAGNNKYHEDDILGFISGKLCDSKSEVFCCNFKDLLSYYTAQH